MVFLFDSGNLAWEGGFPGGIAFGKSHAFFLLTVLICKGEG